MRSVPPGFARPEAATGRGRIAAESTVAATCPGAVVAPWGHAPNVHPYWGPWFRIGMGHARDEALRYRASSGGALSALLIQALRSKLIDRVAHVAPDPINPTANIVTYSTSEAEVIERSGSRYAASSPLSEIERMLRDGGAFAFVGKPCDVSALRLLGRHDARVDEHVPLMLSFFCAGIPSERAIDRLLSAMRAPRSDVVAFRYRGNGWPGRAAATLADGRLVAMSYEESWGEYLCKEVQFRCKICPDAVGGVADIACGDAWYPNEDGAPGFADRPGRSLIVSRTAIGDRLLSEAVAAGSLSIERLAAQQIEVMQPSQAQRKRLVRARVAALGMTLQPKPIMQGVRLAAAARTAGGIEQIRNLLGTVRRVVLRRR